MNCCNFEKKTFGCKACTIYFNLFHTLQGTEPKIKSKRKLVVDEEREIAEETMKLQLSDTSDIVTTLDLAPPTKKLVHWQKTGGVEKLLTLPGHAFLSKHVSMLFQRNLVTSPLSEVESSDEESNLDDSNLPNPCRNISMSDSIPNNPASVSMG